MSVLSTRRRSAHLGWLAAGVLLAFASPTSLHAQVLEIGDDGVARPVGGGWSRAAPDRQLRAPASRCAEIEATAAATNVNAKLLETVARTELGLDPAAVSPFGAIGVMQLMPAAAALGVDPHDGGQNILGGARYLHAQLDRFDGRIDGERRIAGIETLNDQLR